MRRAAVLLSFAPPTDLCWCGGWIIRRAKYSCTNYFHLSCCNLLCCSYVRHNVMVCIILLGLFHRIHPSADLPGSFRYSLVFPELCPLLFLFEETDPCPSFISTWLVLTVPLPQGISTHPLLQLSAFMARKAGPYVPTPWCFVRISYRCPGNLLH